MSRFVYDLSPAQERAFNKLSTFMWYNAYHLQESRSTLDSLVRKGYADRKTKLGYTFDPRVNILYKARSFYGTRRF